MDFSFGSPVSMLPTRPPLLSFLGHRSRTSGCLLLLLLFRQETSPEYRTFLPQAFRSSRYGFPIVFQVSRSHASLLGERRHDLLIAAHMFLPIEIAGILKQSTESADDTFDDLIVGYRLFQRGSQRIFESGERV